MANVSELLNGWGFGKQTAIGTANLVASIWRHTNLNTKPWAKVPVNEDDRAEIGKGHEFPTQLFKSHYNMPASSSRSMPRRSSSRGRCPSPWATSS